LVSLPLAGVGGRAALLQSYSPPAPPHLPVAANPMVARTPPLP